MKKLVGYQNLLLAIKITKEIAQKNIADWNTSKEKIIYKQKMDLEMAFDAGWDKNWITSKHEKDRKMIRFLIGFSSTFFNTAGLPGSIICYRVYYLSNHPV